MGIALAKKGTNVTLCARRQEAADEINQQHKNDLLPEVPLPSQISATISVEETVTGKDAVFLACPSHYLLAQLNDLVRVPSIMEGETTIAILTKGFLKTSKGYRLITETLEDYLPGFYHDKLVYVSGPAHAEEVARGKITGLIAASANPKNAITVRDLISSERMLVYASLDPIGVQVCAAAKNVVAIAFGILDALKQNVHIFGDNTESLLLAAGLNEIQTLGMALGATHAETFTSIAGVGDLDVTCRSVFGRNRRFGQDIVNLKIHERFSGLDDILARIKEIGYLPEGAAAAKAIREIAAEKGLSLPICDGVFRLLNRECAVHELFIELCGSGFSKK
jgi:glycerol-3-phosphate dehydrogenase (NAD(P)+)